MTRKLKWFLAIALLVTGHTYGHDRPDGEAPPIDAVAGVTSGSSNIVENGPAETNVKKTVTRSTNAISITAREKRPETEAPKAASNEAAVVSAVLTNKVMTAPTVVTNVAVTVVTNEPTTAPSQQVVRTVAPPATPQASSNENLTAEGESTTPQPKETATDPDRTTANADAVTPPVDKTPETPPTAVVASNETDTAVADPPPVEPPKENAGTVTGAQKRVSPPPPSEAEQTEPGATPRHDLQTTAEKRTEPKPAPPTPPQSSSSSQPKQDSRSNGVGLVAVACAIALLAVVLAWRTIVQVKIWNHERVQTRAEGGATASPPSTGNAAPAAATATEDGNPAPETDPAATPAANAGDAAEADPAEQAETDTASQTPVPAAAAGEPESRPESAQPTTGTSDPDPAKEEPPPSPTAEDPPPAKEPSPGPAGGGDGVAAAAGDLVDKAKREEERLEKDRKEQDQAHSQLEMWNTRIETLREGIASTIDEFEKILSVGKSAGESLPEETWGKLQGRQQGLELIGKMMRRLGDRLPDSTTVQKKKLLSVDEEDVRAIVSRKKELGSARQEISSRMKLLANERYQQLDEIRRAADRSRKSFVDFVQKQVLPILDGVDDGERSSEALMAELKAADAGAAEALDTWFGSYDKLRQLLLQMLVKVKVERMHVQRGEVIDYEKHEPFEVEPDEELQDEHVKAITRHGYELNDGTQIMVLRAAQVIAVKN